MVDYKEIPELIRAFLAATDATGQRGWDADTNELAEAYSTLVREANDRLRRCAEYLRRGMRSEAVHLAECQPRLVELAESLRLPDPARWARVCSAHELPPPPELLTDGLESLQGSFEVEREIEPLLARHRLLALAQAPVKDRIEVLRAIAEQDSDNPCWDEGLRMVETARFKEMRAEAKVAFRSHDRAALERLSSELHDHPLRSPIPDDLREGLDKAVNSIRLEAVRKKLTPLLANLEAARSAGDFKTAADLLSQWQETIDAGKVVLPPDVQQKVRPVVAWLAAEERRRGVERKMQSLQPLIESGQKDVTSWMRDRTMRMVLIGAGAAVVLVALIVAYIHFSMRP